MAKFTTDYVNLIANNLRDRYRTGFPILKELVQNADDAGATSLTFGYHDGIDGAEHELLQGPALWVLNNGRFKPQDRQAIQSFGLNSKAAESGSIGKFGLGMKSVFHLCEAFFYVASDGTEEFLEVLSPWFQDTGSYDKHVAWEQLSARDLDALKAVARSHPTAQPDQSWFMLWVPLRRRSHVPHIDGEATAPIIDRYPGDDSGEDLDFFTEPGIDQRIGNLLPLLRRLERVQFSGTQKLPAFDVRLNVADGAQRLDHETDELIARGTVSSGDTRSARLHFMAMQTTRFGKLPFNRLQEAAGWPKSNAIVALGKRAPVPDKGQPEGAVLVSHADGRRGHLSVQWAVFLPTEDQGFRYEAHIPNSSREIAITLHGQFFVDAGRRGIEGMDRLADAVDLTSTKVESAVQVAWNQALAQQIVLPMVLPAIARYVQTEGFGDEHVTALTEALTRCSAIGDSGARVFFSTAFFPQLCREHVWVRVLRPEGAAWKLLPADEARLLLLPRPVDADRERPWRVLPGLRHLRGVEFVDNTAPRICPQIEPWTEEEVCLALEGLPAASLSSEIGLRYLNEFLSMHEKVALNTERVRSHLVALIRSVLRDCPLTEVRAQRQLFRQLVAQLPNEKWYGIGTRTTAANGSLPDSFYKLLAASTTDALLLPADLTPEGDPGRPSFMDIETWLRCVGDMAARGIEVGRCLDVAEVLVGAVSNDREKQSELLRRNTSLRVLRAFDVRNSEELACSLEQLLEVHSQGQLFKSSDPKDRFGLTKDLGRAVPGLKLLVIRPLVGSHVQSAMLSGSEDLPQTTSAAAMFRCIGEQALPPNLAEPELTKRLLAQVSSVENLNIDAVRRGVRYLLHGNADHFHSNGALWKDPSGQTSPWVLLWRMVAEDTWNVLRIDLSAQIPDTCSKALGIVPVDQATVTTKLRTEVSFHAVRADEFTQGQRDLILGQLDDETAWHRLPLHRDIDGEFGPATGACYLGSEPGLPPCLDVAIRFISASSDEAHLRRQHTWLTRWSAAHAASEVLRSGQADQHWRYLMDLLPELTSRAALAAPWHEVAWLPLRAGGTISLSRLIRLEALGADISSLAVGAGYIHAGLADLSDELRAHEAFGWLEPLAPSGGLALAMLGHLMASSGLLVGRRAREIAAHVDRHLVVLSSLRSAPGWELVSKAIAATSLRDVEVHLLGSILAPLPTAQAQHVLRELVQGYSYSQVREVFLLYLKEWVESGSVVELRGKLSTLSLPAADGTWRPATELAHGAFGVVAASVVDADVADVLAGVIVSNSGAPAQMSDDAVDCDRAGECIESALEGWSEPYAQSGVRPAVGALMGLFGDRARALAESWVAPISFGDYLLKINWKDPGYETGLDRRARWMGGHSSAERPFALLKPVFEPAANAVVSALSLTGEELNLSLDDGESMTTLLAGPLRWLGGYGVEVRIRPIDSLDAFDLDRRKAILQETAESLLRSLYSQDHANLTELWNLFEQADQVELDVAHSLILEGLPQLMSQLAGVKRHPSIAAVLEALDKGRRDLASAERAKSNVDGPRGRIRKALDELETLVVEDASVQMALLQAIQKKLVRFQYEPSSMPFELLQNADDAVVQYQEMQRVEGRQTFTDADVDRFVITRTNHGLVLVHWGRPINHTGRNENYRSEYAKDLERMLMLGASAKELDDGVTGKFGLGFKSIFLITERPVVKSGDLQFEIVAGCLPRRASLGDEAKAVEVRYRHTALRPTIIELPIADGSRASLGRFRALAGLCTVFARQIRRITVDAEEYGWKPARLLETAGAWSEIGLVQLPHKDRLIPGRLLVLRCEQGAAVVRIDGGAARFDHEADFPVPAIWVHAPTRGTPATGLALNADFDIDTGRGSLPQGAGAQRNRDMACDLASSLAPVLADLVTQSRSDWPLWSERLAARKDMQAAAFWHAFWTTVFVDAGNDASQDVQLVAAHVDRLFDEVVARTGLVPNGLPGELAAFANPDDLRVAIRCDRLQQVLPVLQRWPAFMAMYPIETWCGFEVRTWLDADEGADEKVRIKELDRDVLLLTLGEGDKRRLGPDELASLAAVIRAWPQGLTEVQGWRNGLALVQLKSRAKAWKPAYNLYIPVTGANDPILGFLPDDMLLDTAYEKCKGDWESIRPYLSSRMLPADELVRCALAASSADSRLAVVSWLARSLDNMLVWFSIRSRMHGDHWLSTLQEDPALLAHLSHEDGALLLARLHPGGTEQDEVEELEQILAPVLSLELIHDWWLAKGQVHLRDYEEALWPKHVDRKRLAADEPDRDTWMTLFSLGVFRRFGRVRDEQNRAFLEFLQDRGWWRTISQVDPDHGPDQWMAILREYAETNQVSGLFERWMDSFASLYRLARWYDEYVHLFRGLQYRSQQEARHLLTPADDYSFSGSGFDAPTLHRTLRVGHNLVVRELLRVGVLRSETAQRMAYMPGRAVLDFLAELGHPDLQKSEEIHDMLVQELGSVERASFGGDFDIPLIMLALDPALREEVWAWAERDEPDPEPDIEEELV